jgi:poly(A) polymerase
LKLKEIDPDALKVVRKLLASGHEAYLVGGCVRDLYVGGRPKDFDVATSATPEEIRRLFRNSRIIGRRFKLAHIYFGSKIIETSTFRTAPAVTSGDEDPLIVQDNEWGSVEDDAVRRDFTVNGLFYDIESERIVDFVDGMDDLDDGVIRTIGDPVTRFREDPVRMIRAIKFAARLDFIIERQTYEGLLEVAPDITKCSRARVLEELYKLLRSGSSRRSFELMLETKVLEYVWPAYVKQFEEHGGLRLSSSQADPDEPGQVLWRYLAALDAYTKETRQVASNGVLQAVLFAPLVGDEMLTGNRQELDARIEELMKPPCVALGVAKRDRELARQIIMAHRRMVQPNPRRRRASIAQRQYFHDALVFLGIAVSARGGDDSELAHWQALAALRSKSESSSGSGGRRRRRGGRRRRGSSGGKSPGGRRSGARAGDA